MTEPPKTALHKELTPLLDAMQTDSRHQSAKVVRMTGLAGHHPRGPGVHPAPKLAARDQACHVVHGVSIHRTRAEPDPAGGCPAVSWTPSQAETGTSGATSSTTDGAMPGEVLRLLTGLLAARSGHE